VPFRLHGFQFIDFREARELAMVELPETCRTMAGEHVEGDWRERLINHQRRYLGHGAP
jgi:hypothetical protein